MHAAAMSVKVGTVGTIPSIGDLALYFASIAYVPSGRLEVFRGLATSQSLRDLKKLEQSRDELLLTLDKMGCKEAVACRLAAFNPQLQDRSFTSMQEILPGLFIGSYHPASNKQMLRAHNITHVCCCIGVPPPFPLEFKYHVFPAKDVPEEDILRYFRGAISFMDEALTLVNGRVLVHCGAGISRAATIATAFLMHRLRLGLKDALNLVHSARPFVRPNPGFLLQLKHFETLLELQSQSPSLVASPAASATMRTKSLVSRPVTAAFGQQLSLRMPELRARRPPASLRAQSAALHARRR